MLIVLGAWLIHSRKVSIYKSWKREGWLAWTLIAIGTIIVSYFSWHFLV